MRFFILINHICFLALILSLAPNLFAMKRAYEGEADNNYAKRFRLIDNLDNNLEKIPETKGPRASSALEAAELMGKQDFLVNSKYAKEFLKNICPVAEIPDVLVKAGLKFTTQNIKDFNIELSKRFAHLNLIPVLYAPLKLVKEKKAHLVFFGAFYLGHSPIGFFGYVVRKKERHLSAEIKSVYFDKSHASVKGIAASLMEFFSQVLSPKLGVSRETLKADYVGRYVWAKQGFDFHPTDRCHDIDGLRYPTVVVARSSLARFLTKNNIAILELVLRDTPVTQLEELKTLEDFADLSHKDNLLVTLQPLVNQNTLGPATSLPIGKAFLMSDNRIKKEDIGPFVRSKGGLLHGAKFPTDVMPCYNAIRIIPKN